MFPLPGPVSEAAGQRVGGAGPRSARPTCWPRCWTGPGRTRRPRRRSSGCWPRVERTSPGCGRSRRCPVGRARCTRPGDQASRRPMSTETSSHSDVIDAATARRTNGSGTYRGRPKTVCSLDRVACRTVDAVPYRDADPTGAGARRPRRRTPAAVRLTRSGRPRADQGDIPLSRRIPFVPGSRRGNREHRSFAPGCCGATRHHATTRMCT